MESRFLLPDGGMERLLEGCGAGLAEARMPPARVMEAFDVFTSGFGSLQTRRVRRPTDQLATNTGEVHI